MLTDDEKFNICYDWKCYGDTCKNIPVERLNEIPLLKHAYMQYILAEATINKIVDELEDEI